MTKTIVFVCILLLIVGCVTTPSRVLELVALEKKPDLDTLNKGLKLGDPISSPDQLYPSDLRQIGQEGWVLVMLDVDIDGNTDNVKVIDLSPVTYKEFAILAKKYVKELAFNRPHKNGEKKAIYGYFLLVNFTLSEDYKLKIKNR